jgi:hypothetical protein
MKDMTKRNRAERAITDISYEQLRTIFDVTSNAFKACSAYEIDSPEYAVAIRQACMLEELRTRIAIAREEITGEFVSYDGTNIYVKHGSIKAVPIKVL